MVLFGVCMETLKTDRKLLMIKFKSDTGMSGMGPSEEGTSQDLMKRERCVGSLSNTTANPTLTGSRAWSRD